MSTSALVDQAIRDRIGPWAPDAVPALDAFDLDRNVVVRAAAGSGKTTHLVGRMVALVRRGVPLPQIAAITFTREAAGEMRARFFEELSAAREALTGVERDHVEQALADLEQGFIDTIHAFCARLLRERPLEAALPPGFTTLEERDEQPLRREAWQRYLSRRLDDSPDDLEHLEALGMAPHDLFDFFSELCRFPDLPPLTEADAARPDLDDALERTRQFVATWQAHRPPQTADDKDPDRVMEAFDTAEALLAHLDMDEDRHRARVLREIARAMKDDDRAHVTLSRWGARGSDAYAMARTLRDEALPTLYQQVVAPALQAWDAFVYRHAASFVRPAVTFYLEERRRNGTLTFHDLLLGARDLLRDHPDVRRALQERYRYLLVDEFQDTDPIQAEVLFYLTGTNHAATDWTACAPRPGSLFIVGDDKQSIYRFRRADMQVFDQVARLIERGGGEAVRLVTNFRSREPICAWCNDAFDALFDGHGAPYQAQYDPLRPHRDAGHDPTALRQLRTPKVPWNRAEAIAEHEAEEIARFIRGALDGEAAGMTGDDGAVFEAAPRYGDFMILTRLTKRLPVYAEALTRYGIPYTIAGSKTIGADDELRALVDLLALAMRPDDAVARVAHRRGLLAGWSDDLLFRFRHVVGGSFSDPACPDLSDHEDALTDEEIEQIRDAFAQEARARRLLHTLPTSAAVDVLLDERGLLAAAASGEAGSLRAGGLLRVRALIHELEAQGLHTQAILDELDLILDGEREMAAMTLETGAEDAVRLMNVHQAKGLEADVVFLADPYDSGHRPTPSLHVARRDDGEDDVVVLPARQRVGDYGSTTLAAPKAWDDHYAEEEERFDAAEERRLLYVAATRARNLLVVGRYEGKDDQGFWSDLYPFLERHDIPDLETLPATPRAHRGAPPDLPTSRERRRTRLADAQTPSYRVRTITDDLAHAEGAEERGYGAAFGTALHALFAWLLQHPDAPNDQIATMRSLLLARHVPP
ncbi:MAG: UvrD-helicase domain-containing protein, partial [Bacteroidetes bacterium]|nr:UvrD-helicase domain-containing protein [Bacteroidota bacterium]